MKKYVFAVLFSIAAAPWPAQAQVSPLVARLTMAYYDYQVIPTLQSICSAQALSHYRALNLLVVQVLQTGSTANLPQLQQEAIEMHRTASPECEAAIKAVQPPPSPHPGSSNATCMGSVCCSSTGCTR